MKLQKKIKAGIPPAYIQQRERCLSLIRAISQPTAGDPDVGALERLTAALGEGGVLTQGRSRRADQRGRGRPLGRDRAVLRDAEGYDFLSDVVRPTALGYGGDVAGYWGTDAFGGRDMNRAGSCGQRRGAEGARRQALHRLLHLLKLMTSRRASTAALRIQAWLDDGEEIADADPASPLRRLARARGLRHVGRRLHRAPGPRAHPASRRLGRPPASARTRRSAASRCSSRTSV